MCNSKYLKEQINEIANFAKEEGLEFVEGKDILVEENLLVYDPSRLDHATKQYLMDKGVNIAYLRKEEGGNK